MEIEADTDAPRSPGEGKRRAIHPKAQPAVTWFVDQIRHSLEGHLLNVTVYGPAVTAIYTPADHRIHHVIVLSKRDLNGLLELAKQSKQATHQRIAPPLVITADSMRRSWDVFPLEWLDISQFHRTVYGSGVLAGLQIDQPHVRLQCERELRALDIQLQQGILASGGKVGRIDRLEDEASDTLIRVLRGVAWLSGDRVSRLPDELCGHCAEVLQCPLPGCLEAIRVDGRHDLHTIGLMLEEIDLLSQWVDHFACDKDI